MFQCAWNHRRRRRRRRRRRHHHHHHHHHHSTVLTCFKYVVYLKDTIHQDPSHLYNKLT